MLFVVPQTDEEAAGRDASKRPIDFDKVNAELPEQYKDNQDDIEHLLQPYGIFYSDIEQAYQTLSKFEQLLMDWQNPVKYAEQLEALGYASELLHGKNDGGVIAGLVAKATGCVDALTKDNSAIGIKHTCVILCDTLDIEAVSTARICSKALTDMGERALVAFDTPTDEILDVIEQGGST